MARRLRRRYGRSTGGYQGWANYETWNVALWLGNDYGLYQAVLAEARERGGKVTATQAKEIVKDLMPGGTPDFKGRGGSRAYSKVKWSEIADDINEMAGG